MCCGRTAREPDQDQTGAARAPSGQAARVPRLLGRQGRVPRDSAAGDRARRPPTPAGAAAAHAVRALRSLARAPALRRQAAATDRASVRRRRVSRIKSRLNRLERYAGPPGTCLACRGNPVGGDGGGARGRREERSAPIGPGVAWPREARADDARFSTLRATGRDRGRYHLGGQTGGRAWIVTPGKPSGQSVSSSWC